MSGYLAQPLPADVRHPAGLRFCGSAVVLVAAAILLLTANAPAQIAGRILFLNATNGEYLIGGVDPSGYFHSTPSATRPTLVGTTILQANNTALVAYNRNTGYSELVAIDGFGNAAFHPQYFGSNWNTITGSGGDLLFYSGNGNQGGQGVIYALKQGATFDREIITTDLSPWTNIVQNDDYLLFYNQVTGLFDETILSPVYSGLLQNAKSVATLPTGYSLMSAVNDNVILYNSGTGAFRVMSMYFVGNGNDFADARDTGTLEKYYGAILPTAGRVVFYSYGSGDVLVGHLSQSGQLDTDKKTRIPIYTDAFTSGQYVCFYSAESGELAVYSVSTGGTLTLRSSGKIGSGYTFSATTQP